MSFQEIQWRRNKNMIRPAAMNGNATSVLKLATSNRKKGYFPIRKLRIERSSDCIYNVVGAIGSSELELSLPSTARVAADTDNVNRSGVEPERRLMQSTLVLMRGIQITLEVSDTTPFSEEEMEYIMKLDLDPSRDCEMLSSEVPMIREASLRMLVLCTIFLLETTASGLCLAEAGQMMSRDFRCHQVEPERRLMQSTLVLMRGIQITLDVSDATPFSEEEMEYIMKLDPSRDCEMLSSEVPMIREASLRMLVLCTIFLLETTASGLCLTETGQMMSKDFRCHQEEPCDLGLLCLKAKETIAKGASPSPTDVEFGDETFQFDIDSRNTEMGMFPETPEDVSGNMSESESENLLSGVTKWQYGVEEDSPVDDETLCEDASGFEKDDSPAPKPLKKTEWKKTKSLFYGRDFICYPRKKCRRVAGSRLPATTGLVKMEDLSEKEWKLFMARFQELLSQTFADWKMSGMGLKQTRLRDSCEF